MRKLPRLYVFLIIPTLLPLAVVAEAQTYEVNLTYSTATSSTLSYPNPALTSDNKDAVSYGYRMETGSAAAIGGTVNGALASKAIDGAAVGNSDEIAGLSVVNAVLGQFYLATSTGSTWGGIAVEPDDIVFYDSLNDTATVFWEGDDHSDGNFIIDALHVYADGTFLLSTSATETIYGLGIRDGDIALVNPATSSASIFFSEDLFAAAADIKAISIETTTGNLVFSTASSETIGGLSYGAGDVVMWDGSSASVVFRASDHFSSGELVNALGSFSLIQVPEPAVPVNIFLAMAVFLSGRRRR